MNISFPKEGSSRRAPEMSGAHPVRDNAVKRLPGIARLVSGIRCMFGGKLAIQSAKRMSVLP